MSNPNSEPFDIYDPNLFFELSPDLLCIAGYDGYFKKINPAVSDLLGYSHEELMSRPINEFIHPDDRGITGQFRENLIKGMPLLNFENRYISKYGEVIWLAWTSIPLDSVKHIYAIAKNISHKKIIEEERTSLITKLSNLNEELQQLSFTTSHDLRSPVNNLLSVFSLLDVSKIQDEETLEFINILKSATEGLKDTLNKYVDILLDKGNSSIHVEELNLREVLEKVMNSISTLILTTKTEIKFNFSQAGTIVFNRGFLESIFLNLITNSIKYTKPEIAPKINFISCIENGQIHLVSSDEGQGFDMEKVKDKVFGLYLKFHNHSDSKGVGLFLIHSHITALGGSIALESSPGNGAKFIIKFK